MSAVAVALPSVAVVLFLALSYAALVAYFKFLRHRTETSASGTARDLEKGLPTARFADGPAEAVVDSPKPAAKNCQEETAAVRKFGWEEIEALTENFMSAVIGEGGFSTVYLARFADSSLGAVKVCRNSGGSERLHRAFRQELDVLLSLRRHPHIVRLLGYCDDREEGVLVFEYVPNGNLHEGLHGGGGTTTVLPWTRRMSVALQLARAVEYLHDGCALQIVHCDIKASNVLLDDRLGCTLCDFGSARMGFEATVLPPRLSSSGPGAAGVIRHHRHPAMMGSPGYVDPHYLRTGIVSKKGDVYSFGVLLLELVTGVEAFCSEKEQMLTAVVGVAIREGGCGVLGGLVDPRLGGEYDAEEAAEAAALAMRCVGDQPSLRPSMAEIARTIGELASSSTSDIGGKSRR